MDLKTFVSTTLAEIVEGVAEAQALTSVLGAAVNPTISKSSEHATYVGKTSNGLHAYAVEFDVALTATSGSDLGVGAKLTVASMFSLGADAKKSATEGTTSRIKFVVSLALPEEPVTAAALKSYHESVRRKQEETMARPVESHRGPS